MNKEQLKALLEEILQDTVPSPTVKGGEYKPENPGPEQKPRHYRPGDFVEDVTALDLRKLYLQENPQNGEAFLALKAKTPARLGSGRAGPRYKTLTMLRFRADHAAAQDSVFSQVPEDYAEKNDLMPLQTCCQDKEQYITRPDLGRRFPEETTQALKQAFPNPPKVLLVVGDGLSSAAITENAADCLAAIRDGLKVRGIETGKALFVRYCRVGAGDALGDATGCSLVCMLVGERPGLVTDKSMSAYITYMPRVGVPESARTVVSNIHAQGTPAAEAGAHIAQLIEKILKKQVSGVGLHLEETL